MLGQLVLRLAAQPLGELAARGGQVAGAGLGLGQQVGSFGAGLRGRQLIERAHRRRIVAAQRGQELTKARLARDCGVSQPTIANWLGVLEASYVVSLLPPYFRNHGKRLIKSPKLYFIDPLLVTTLTRQPSPEAALAGPMGGALLEGWVVVEAVKAFTNRGLKPDLYFWRSHDGLEVDLLVQAGTRLHPVEIKRTATPTPQHVEPLTRLRALLGEEAAAAGLLVCGIDRERPMPQGHRALPWQAFPAWLGRLLDGVR